MSVRSALLMILASVPLATQSREGQAVAPQRAAAPAAGNVPATCSAPLDEILLIEKGAQR